jgi:hypothetical protein
MSFFKAPNSDEKQQISWTVCGALLAAPARGEPEHHRSTQQARHETIKQMGYLVDIELLEEKHRILLKIS